MINYSFVEKVLNEEAKKILMLIKEDYYTYMSPKKKQILDELISSGQMIVVNQGRSHFNDNTLAHGGRALRDGKIHFYPDVRGFSTEEAIGICKRLLPHECFHYFIQPDAHRLASQLEQQMANFYTEGAVEKEARIFCGRHKEIDFEQANYGYNINFVNLIQERLGASSYTTIFSESDYIKDIAKYTSEYKNVLQQQKQDLDGLEAITKSFSENLQKKLFRRIRPMILQDGNTIAVRKKLEEFDFISIESLRKLDAKSSGEPR